MKLSSSPRLNQFTKEKLKRFNLDEKLNMVEAKSQEQTHTPESSFDWQFYLAYHEDLQELSSCEAAYEHWCSCGKFEERIINEADLNKQLNFWETQLPDGFNYIQYLALNQDLKAKLECHQYKQHRAIEHYVKHGQHEKRQYLPLVENLDFEQFKSARDIDTVDLASSETDYRSAYGQLKPQTNPKLIAFYLPQFHPIPENDKWWGKGFTEWTNVSRARPLFDGHYQPHLPADLGFYDLRLPEVREEQAQLAQQYGIYGFCYYYYWFAGKKLLHRPLDEILETGKPNFPFCICWANENWTRRWDGAEHEVLIAQEYSEEQYQAFAEDLITILRDTRYIRINGKPLIIIYRIDIVPDAKKATECWREVFRANGIGEVHLSVVLTCFSGFRSGLTDLTAVGFDSAVQFPPHETAAIDVTPPAPTGHFTGRFFNYEEVACNSVAETLPESKIFPGVMSSFDNTSRRGNAAHVFLNSTPEAYEFWLCGAIEKARQNLAVGEQFVFINAWNEWAEGAHLEPDQRFGHAYLQATQRAIHCTYNWRITLNLLRYLPSLSRQQFNRLLKQLELQIDAVDRASYGMLTVIELILERKQGKVVCTLLNPTSDTHFRLDSPTTAASIDAKYIKIDGWIISTKTNVSMIEVKHNQAVLKQIPIDISRSDVAEAYGISDCKLGFCDVVDIDDVSSRIDLHLDVVLEDGSSYLICAVSIQLDQEWADFLDELSEKCKQLQHNTDYCLHAELNTLRAIGHQRGAEFKSIIATLEKALNQKSNCLQSICEFLQATSSPFEYR